MPHAVDSTGNVVNDAGLKSGVAVEEKAHQEYGVDHGVLDTANEGKHGERNQGDCENALVRPVVAALVVAGHGRNVGIVNGADNVARRLRRQLELGEIGNKTETSRRPHSCGHGHRPSNPEAYKREHRCDVVSSFFFFPMALFLLDYTKHG